MKPKTPPGDSEYMKAEPAAEVRTGVGLGTHHGLTRDQKFKSNVDADLGS